MNSNKGTWYLAPWTWKRTLEAQHRRVSERWPLWHFQCRRRHLTWPRSEWWLKLQAKICGHHYRRPHLNLEVGRPYLRWNSSSSTKKKEFSTLFTLFCRGPWRWFFSVNQKGRHENKLRKKGKKLLSKLLKYKWNNALLRGDENFCKKVSPKMFLVYHRIFCQKCHNARHMFICRIFSKNIW